MSNQPPNLNAPKISDTTGLVCDKCNHNLFQQATILRGLSALVSPNGQKTLIPVPVWCCAKCGHVNEEFLPVEIKEEFK